MRAAFVIQKLAGLGGGAERVLADVTTGLAGAGTEVRILTYESRAGDAAYPLFGVTHRNLFPWPRLTSRGTGAGKEKGTGYRAEALIKALPNRWPLPQLKWAATYAPFIRALRRDLAADPPDVVVGFMPTGIMAAAMAAAPLGVPVIGSTHNLPAQDYGDGPRWDANPLYRQHRRAALDLCAAITVLQPEFAAALPAHLADRIVVMPNAVTQADAPLPDAADRDRLILGVGRLTDVKRFDRLITAFAGLASDFPDWRLAIHGQGPEHPALAHLIADKGLGDQVQLAGQTADIFATYRKASILAHPAAFEGFGLVVGEALSHGVPVVAHADCPGVNRLVTDGQTGLLAPEGTEAFATALRRMMADDAARTAMGAAGPAAMADYTPARVLEHWQALLGEVRLAKPQPI